MSRISGGFNRLATVYDFLVLLTFGNSLLKAQFHFLPEIQKANTILIFGGGTGKLLDRCLQLNPTAHYSYVDLSSHMVEKAKSRCGNNNVQFICGTEKDIPQEQNFDIILTPFVLDCFNQTELSVTITKLKEHLCSSGKWIFTDFHIPHHRLWSIFARILIILMYCFFNAFCSLGVWKLPDFQSAFGANNLQVVSESYFRKGILCARVYSK